MCDRLIHVFLHTKKNFKNSDTAFLKECFNKKRQTSLQILMNN